MAKELTGQYMFNLIKTNFFKDVDVESVANMTEAELFDFTMQQADRLLDEKSDVNKDKGANAAAWFGDQFWLSDVDGRTMQARNPLFNPDEREKMSDDERALCAFYITLSGLCSDLYNHQEFDLMMIGINGEDNDMMVSNKALTKWLRTTPYVHIAMHIAFTMKLSATALMSDCGYQAAQDFLAELYWKHHGVIVAPEMKNISPREYIDFILGELEKIDKHIEDGLKMGLTTEEIFIYDSMYGFFTDRYEKTVVPFAKELNKYLCDQYDRQSWSMRLLNEPLNRQPKPMQRQIKTFVNDFISKVRKVRDDNFGKGWLEDDSLSMGYLIDHAQMKANGQFDD